MNTGQFWHDQLGSSDDGNNGSSAGIGLMVIMAQEYLKQKGKVPQLLKCQHLTISRYLAKVKVLGEILGQRMLALDAIFNHGSTMHIGGGDVSATDRIDKPIFALTNFVPVGAAGGTGKSALLQANRAAGNAFRDELASLLEMEGRQIKKEVYKWTPFGARYIDIEVSQAGKVLGGIESKVGKSSYTFCKG